MDNLIISELKRTFNRFTGYTEILIRIAVQFPHKMEICIGDSEYVITNSITITLIQKS